MRKEEAITLPAELANSISSATICHANGWGNMSYLGNMKCNPSLPNLTSLPGGRGILWITQARHCFRNGD